MLSLLLLLTVYLIGAIAVAIHIEITIIASTSITTIEVIITETFLRVLSFRGVRVSGFRGWFNYG